MSGLINNSTPRCLHPSYGTNTISVGELQGASGLRKTQMIPLKEKDGTHVNMVMSWILNSVSGSIKKSIIFISTIAKWKQLEQRHSIANGARQYSLNKQTY
ncbi:Fructose-1 6-bisphosphatase chloroplastic [Bienertia sinuspersici]